MTKYRLFHAGRGKWEVRYRKDGRIFGIGYFFQKKEAQKIIRKNNNKRFLSIPNRT